MNSHGELTAEIAEKISKDWGERGYKVLYDHGDPANKNVGKIASWIGEKYMHGAQLSQLDIAIVEKSSDKIFALIEIEETNDRPKTFLGDVYGVLMGAHIRFGGKLDLAVDKNTTLIILGKCPEISKSKHDERNKFLLGKIMEIKPGIYMPNSAVGKIVLESVSDENKFYEVLTNLLKRSFAEMI